MNCLNHAKIVITKHNSRNDIFIHTYIKKIIKTNNQTEIHSDFFYLLHLKNNPIICSAQ